MSKSTRIKRTSEVIKAEIDKTALALTDLKKELKLTKDKEVLDDLTSLLHSAIKTGRKMEVKRVLEQINGVGI